LRFPKSYPLEQRGKGKFWVGRGLKSKERRVSLSRFERVQKLNRFEIFPIPALKFSQTQLPINGD
jgi:hypothetical protein